MPKMARIRANSGHFYSQIVILTEAFASHRVGLGPSIIVAMSLEYLSGSSPYLFLGHADCAHLSRVSSRSMPSRYALSADIILTVTADNGRL
jgi:hypothetical protein